MKALREYSDSSDEGERSMNIMKSDLKDLYFKRQDVFPFGNYVNRLKEYYNTLEELRQPEFEEQKVRTLL